jgi:hypothetical protein
VQYRDNRRIDCAADGFAPPRERYARRDLCRRPACRAWVHHATMNTPTMSSGSHGKQARRTFAAAPRFTGLVVAVAMLVLVLGLLWVNGCKSGTGDEALAQCGGVQRNLLGIGSPLILLLGGLAAFVRTYHVWRARGRWWIWQGAGWFLLVLMLVVLTMTVPVALH